MATVVVCDRCHSIAQVSALAGRELCSTCVDQFRAWVDAGNVKRALGRAKRSGSGQLRDAILRLGRESECITVAAVATLAGVSEKSAYEALRHWKSRGVLVQPRKGVKVYALAELEQKAAE
jgi:hypothetical protein